MVIYVKAIELQLIARCRLAIWCLLIGISIFLGR